MTRPLRPVVHLTPVFFGDDGVFGGGERYPYELARAMAQEVPTVLVGFGARRRSWSEGPLRIELLPVRRRWAGSDMNPLHESLPRVLGRCGVLHVHQWESVLSNAAVLYGRAVGARVFATDHGGWGRNYWRRLRLHRLLHGFLPVSDFAASFYPDLAARTTVIHGGVDVSRYRPGGSERMDRALFVGRLLPHKGVAELVEALPADLPLHVVGRAYDPSYRARVRALAVGRSVTFDETADDEAVLEAYRTSRVVVLPSLDPVDGRRTKTELLGLTLIEAMACGTPVVCTDTGGMPEVVAEGVGAVVPQRDPAALAGSLRRFVGGGPEWEAASEAARERALGYFTWPATAHRALRAYGAPWTASPPGAEDLIDLDGTAAPRSRSRSASA